LIQPKSKIFEIIQLFYSPSETLVGYLLDSIPGNATEPALGLQEYIGLCRPKGNGHHIDLDMLASGSNGNKECAKIIRGEILVAIPTGYSGPICAKLAEPLLTHPKVQKLLKRSDPLAPKKKKKKRHSSSRRYKSITVDGVNEDLSPYSPKKKETEKDQEHDLLRKALQPEDDTFFPHEVPFVPLDEWKTQMSLRSDSSCSSFASGNCVEGTWPRSPRQTSSHRKTSEMHLSIAEDPREEPADSIASSVQQLGDDFSASSTHSSGGDLAALEAKLNDNDVNGAIEAFAKMLSGRATDKKILEQLSQTLQACKSSD
jgi:putative lipoic acid-binding regulatory protein